MSLDPITSGRLRKAPESFINADGVRRVFAEAKEGRRDFIRSAFAAAVAGGAAEHSLYKPVSVSNIEGESVLCTQCLLQIVPLGTDDLVRRIDKDQSTWNRLLEPSDRLVDLCTPIDRYGVLNDDRGLRKRREQFSVSSFVSAWIRNRAEFVKLGCQECGCDALESPPV